MYKAQILLYEPAEEVQERLKAILVKQKEKLDSINLDDISLLWHNGTPNYQAKIIKTSKYLRALGVRPLVIIIHKDVWDEAGQGKRNLLLFHELLHVVQGEKGYKLLKHDIEDFRLILEQVGLNWEKAEQEFADLYKDSEN